MRQGQADRQSRETAEAVARRSYGKLVAFLAARIRDVAGAEDALSDAFAAALSEWPRNGIPARPEAWLLTVARRRMLDGLRRRRAADDAGDALRLMAELSAPEKAQFPDTRLALMFACAHPAIEAAIHAPLILQTVLGFDAATIGSAFQGQDQTGRHPVSYSGSERACRPAGRGPCGDLRGFLGGLVRSRGHRDEAARLG